MVMVINHMAKVVTVVLAPCVFCCRHPIANHRICSSEIVRILSSDRILLPATDEEQSTVLGDTLEASSQLYLDLQQTYLSDIV